MGHSGSTLLGNVLESHESGFHLGEVIAPLKKNRPIICRSCIDKICPVWGGIIEDKYLYKVYENFKRCLNSKSRFRFLDKVLPNRYSSAIYRKIFIALPHVQFIVDSSKNINWYKYNSKCREYEHKYIFLKRNPLAIYASLKRAYPIDINEYVSLIKPQIDGINDFYYSLPSSLKLSIEYERFAEGPEEILESLTDFIGVNYSARMLEFEKIEHHLIGGNQGVLIQQNPETGDYIDKLVNIKTPPKTKEYYGNSKGIRVDKRWHDELSTLEKEKLTIALENCFKF